MSDWQSIADIRREYGELGLNEETIDESPITQFQQWFDEIFAMEIMDPTAMTLSTVDKKGHPDSRVVLLKEVDKEGFVFYTNYQSKKAMQMKNNAYVALNFYWPQMSRQVRIRGRIKRVSKAQSDAYFASRPLSSQFSAIISPQSQKIQNRTSLECLLNEQTAQYSQEKIVRPRYWGGYLVIPLEIEFWQGRDNRLHDRIFYFKKNKKWMSCRLAP